MTTCIAAAAATIAAIIAAIAVTPLYALAALATIPAAALGACRTLAARSADYPVYQQQQTMYAADMTPTNEAA